MPDCTKCNSSMIQRKDGRWRCRPCANAYQRQQYKVNPNLCRERARITMKRVRAIPERREAINKARRGNPRYLETSRQYSKRLRDTKFFQWRARNWGNGVTARELARLWKTQRGRCALSGRKLDRKAHLDHIVPITEGGSGRLTNIRWLDPWVNIARQNLTDAEFATRCAQVAEFIGKNKKGA
jgi:hypothetical protein